MNQPSREERVNEIIADYLEAVEAGKSPDQTALLRHHPDLAEELRAFFADHDRFRQAADPLGLPAAPVPEPERPAVSLDAPTLGPDETPVSPGTTVRYFGDYELLEEIARGGMGVVFKARQASLNRSVALKMILAGQLASADDVRRFRTEAEAAANLDHPNLVPIYEVGEHQGQHYFSMKLIEGGSLSTFSREPSASAEQQRAIARLVATVARAVHYAHQRGILHRDLKPSNILLDKDGQPYVTDFGLAKRVQGDSKLTQSGAIVGTPGYMAPEQARGNKGLSVATDVYGLGAILYELLTGRPPFQAATPLDTVLQALDREPERPRSLRAAIDRDLETVCLKCLEREPAKRYGSAEALADDLERWLHGEPIRARASTTLERVLKWARRRPATAALVAVSGLAAAVLFGVVLLYNGHLQSALEETQDAKAAADDERNAAEEARSNAEHQRALAESRELEARRYLYGAHVNLMAQAWQSGRVQRVLDLLEAEQPRAGQQDVRGFEWYALWQLCHQDRLTLPAHPFGVNAVAFSPDGKVLATAGDRTQLAPLMFHGVRTVGDIKLWDAATGQLLATLSGHRAAVTSIAFAPDGKTIASGGGGNEEEGRDFTVRLWDVAGRKTRTILRGFPGPITSLSFSADGKLFAAGTTGPRAIAKVLELASETTQVPVRLNIQGCSPVALSPDGQRLATGPGDGDTSGKAVLLWDTASGKRLPGGEGPKTGVGALLFPPGSSQLLYIGGTDGRISLLDLAKGQSRVVAQEHAGSITSLAISRDGQRLASGGRDHTAVVWRILGEPGALEQLRRLRGHTDVVISVALSPDGQSLATGSFDNTAKLWNLAATGPDIVLGAARALINPQAVAFTTNSRMLAVADQQGSVRLWDLTTGKEGTQLPGARLPWAFAADGKTLATASDKGQILLWDLPAARQRLTINPPDGQLSALLFSPAGDSLTIVASGQPTLWPVSRARRCDTATGEERGSFQSGGLWRAAALSPDGKTLAVAEYRNSSLELWDVATGKRQARFKAHHHDLERVAFSPDGQTLATAGSGMKEPEAALWDLPSGRLRGTLKGHTGLITSLAFTPDGRTLATSSFDGAVKLWSTATGEEFWTLPVFESSSPDSPAFDDLSAHGNVNGIAFSPDGHYLAAAGAAPLGSNLPVLATGGAGFLNSTPPIRLWRAATHGEVTARSR
jgi:WD40 repeat protein/tRNA A-37 threonylcarbamoyl transferase component Bud32